MYTIFPHIHAAHVLILKILFFWKELFVVVIRVPTIAEIFQCKMKRLFVNNDADLICRLCKNRKCSFLIYVHDVTSQLRCYST